MAYMDNEEEVIIDTPIDEPIEPEEDTIETPEVDVEQLQATNKKLFERAKKAEADLKALKGTPKPANDQATPLNVEEAVLLAQGFNEDLLPELKAVAQVRKVNLIKAQNDPIFVAVKEKFEKDQKREQASMPASRGSGSVKVKKDFNTPGLTREEHRALIQALN